MKKNIKLFVFIGVMFFTSLPLLSTAAEKEGALGQKPIETEELFLRDKKVLLAPGKIEAEVDFLYSNDSNMEALQLTGGGVVLYKTKNNTFTSVLSTRIGVTDKSELFVSIPYNLYKENEVNINAGTSVTTTSDNGIGDISFGFKYHLLSERGSRPDLILNVSAKSATGRDPYRVSANKLAMGTGHWDISSGLTVVKTIDPVVFFGQLGYTYTFDRTFDGVKISLGNRADYLAGMGFVINDAITYNMQVAGSYQGNTVANGSTVAGSSQNIITMQFGVTAVLSKSFYIQPIVGIGLTSEATDAMLGLSMSYRF